VAPTRNSAIQRNQNRKSGVAIRAFFKEAKLRFVILTILILLVLGALPTWPYSGEWGYFPSGGLALVLAIVLILVLMGRL